MPFKIATLITGNDPDTWDLLEEVLAYNHISFEPDWTFQPYAEVAGSLAGDGFGRGFASATWHLNITRNVQRTILRTYCPGVSADVYISTPTNEDDAYGAPIFKNFQAKMHWMKGQEDKQIRHTLGVDITFTHLIEIIAPPS